MGLVGVKLSGSCGLGIGRCYTYSLHALAGVVGNLADLFCELYASCVCPLVVQRIYHAQ